LCSVCVSVREREREREGKEKRERERGEEIERGGERDLKNAAQHLASLKCKTKLTKLTISKSDPKRI
jgi:hypothetical protein